MAIQILPCLHHKLIIFTLLLLSAAISAVDEDEISSMLILLRSRGHTLFSNAIATSDLIDQILTNNTNTHTTSLTFFAPNDDALFDLDMTDTASDYVSALRCHVVPYRLTFNQLHHFPYGYALRTLLKNHHIHIRSRNSTDSFDDDEIAIYIENVRLSSPGIFYSRHIAVHGLEGILSCTGSGRKSPPIDKSESTGGSESADFRRSSSSPANSPANEPISSRFDRRIEAPVYEPISSTFDRGIEAPAYEPISSKFDRRIEAPAYEPISSAFDRRIEAPAPELSENDDPASFRERDEDSIAGVDIEEEEREKAVLRSLSPSDLNAIVESEPFDEKSVDECHVTDRIYHVMPRGYCVNS